MSNNINVSNVNITPEMLDTKIDDNPLNHDQVWEDVINLIEDREKWINKEKYKTSNKKQFYSLMTEKYKELYTKTPTLFEKSCNGGFEKEEDIQKLEYMIEMSKKIQKDPSSFDNVNKEIGKKFADEYVNPIVEKLNKEKNN